MKKTPYVQQWIKRAQEDLDGAQKLQKMRGPYSLVCFHAQQSVEKILKGFLAFRNQEIEKIHQLDHLLKSCISLDPLFNDLRDDVIFLTKFYIATRYPGDFPEFGMKDAQRAIHAAEYILQFVLRSINKL